MKTLTIFLFFAVFAIAACGDKEAMPTACDNINGEWTVQDNEAIYLNFQDGTLQSGAFWKQGEAPHISETFKYSCDCDTAFLESDQTGFRFWLTFWRLSDTTAILNGQYYAQPTRLKRI